MRRIELLKRPAESASEYEPEEEEEGVACGIVQQCAASDEQCAASDDEERGGRGHEARGHIDGRDIRDCRGGPHLPRAGHALHEEERGAQALGPLSEAAWPDGNFPRQRTSAVLIGIFKS